jgi:hypothetical protein
VISGNYEENLSLDYLVKVWGERPDLRVVITDDFFELFEAGQEDLFLTRGSAGMVLSRLDYGAHLSSAGLHLIAARQEPNREPPPMGQRVDAVLGEDLVLLGYDHLPGADGLRLALYWQAAGELETDYAVSVRPTAGGELLFDQGLLVQEDHAHPVWGLYPMSSWAPGEVVRDDYLVVVPPGLVYDGASVVVYRVMEDGFEDLGSVSLAFDS